MSLLTQAYLLEKYGPRLSMDQLAEVMGIARGTIYNKVVKKELEIATYMDGGSRWCDYRDLATYLDVCRDRAKTPA